MSSKKTETSKFSRKQEAQIAKIQRYLIKTGKNEAGIADWSSREGVEELLFILINEVGFDKELVQEALKRNKIDLKTFPSRKDNNWQTTDNKEYDFIKKIYFDPHGLFMIWTGRKWELKDETDVLNLFEENGWETKKPKNKNYALNLARQEGRKNKPKDLPPHSICFQDCIFDLKNKTRIEVSPEYFITNHLPHKLSDKSETPTIDKFFAEWVGLAWVQTLYEIIAYVCLREQFLQTIIALTGAGSNGKGTFQSLIIKFVGKENCVSSTIKALITRSFESSAIFQKLLCVMGEADSGDLSNSNIIKQFTGEDLMRYEFKGKTSFSEMSPTTFILATNSLPITPDKSIGFYRRWLIIDFPNQFKVKRNLLDEIPEEEFENLGCKLVKIALELLDRQEFTNGGSFEERMERYEERSNPITQFLNHNYVEDGIGFVKLREFAKNLNDFLRSKKLRVLTVGRIGKLLRDEGFEISTRKFRDEFGDVVDSAKSIIGISEKPRVFDQVAESGGLGGSENNVKPPEQPNFDTQCYICEKQAVLINKYQIPYCEYCYQDDYEEYLPRTIAPASLIGITIQKPIFQEVVQ